MPRVNTPSEVTAQLGAGRISDVEADNLQHVQQDRNVPALPSLGNLGQTLPLQLNAQANLADQIKAASNAMTEKAKSLVPGTPTIPDGRVGLGLDSSRANSAAAASSPPGSSHRAFQGPQRLPADSTRRRSPVRPETATVPLALRTIGQAHQIRTDKTPTNSNSPVKAARLADSRLAPPPNTSSGYAERTTTPTNGNYSPVLMPAAFTIDVTLARWRLKCSTAYPNSKHRVALAASLGLATKRLLLPATVKFMATMPIH